MGLGTSPTVIDPLGMLLGAEAFLVWYEANHPRVDRLKAIREVIAELEPEERASLLARIQLLDKYVKGIQLLASPKAVGVTR